jgi:5-hydroxyisourate hydrolase-like protein (transthyretin family)
MVGRAQSPHGMSRRALLVLLALVLALGAGLAALARVGARVGDGPLARSAARAQEAAAVAPLDLDRVSDPAVGREPAPAANLHGRVLDATTGNPIAGLQVALKRWATEAEAAPPAELVDGQTAPNERELVAGALVGEGGTIEISLGDLTTALASSEVQISFGGGVPPPSDALGAKPEPAPAESSPGVPPAETSPEAAAPAAPASEPPQVPQPVPVPTLTFRFAPAEGPAVKDGQDAAQQLGSILVARIAAGVREGQDPGQAEFRSEWLVDGLAQIVRPRPVSRVLGRPQDVGVTVATCTTDAEGRFEFDCPLVDGHWLVIERDGALRHEPERLDVGDPAQSCGRELVWRVTPGRYGALRALVLDARTGTALPDLEVQLRTGTAERERGEALRTDRDGRFELSEVRAGRLAVALRDAAGAWEVPLAGGPPEFRAEDCEGLVLAAQAGPTLRFETDLSQGLLEGGLLARAENLSSNARDLSLWSRDLVHLGAGLGVRLPPDARPARPGPITIQLATADGRLAGRLAAPDLSAPPANPPRVAFALVAVVRGSLRRGEEPLGGARVEARDGTGRVLAAADSAEDGRFVLPAVPAGLEIDVRCPTGAEEPVQLVLAPGEAREVDLALAR